MDAWVEGWMDIRTDGRTDRHIDGFVLVVTAGNAIRTRLLNPVRQPR